MATRTRVNNAPASLQVTTAWTPALASTGAFVSTDLLTWNGVTGSNATVLMGGNIAVSGTGGGVYIGPSQTTAVVLNSSSTANVLSVAGIDMSTAGADLTIGPNPSLTFPSMTVNVASGRKLTTTSGFGGTTSTLTKTGNGTWLAAPSRSSAYNGPIVIQQGVVQIGTASPFASNTSTITMTGGQLSSSSTTAYTLANPLTLNGTMTLGDATNTGALTFSGTTTIGPNPTTLTLGSLIHFFSGPFQGTGNLTVSNNNLYITGITNNNYSGNISLTNGIEVVLGGTTPNQLNSAASVSIATGTTLTYLGSVSVNPTAVFTGAGNVKIYNTNGVVFSASSNLSGFSGAVVTWSDPSQANATSKVTFQSALAFPSAANEIGSKSISNTSPVHTKTYTGTSSITTNSFWSHAASNAPFTVVLEHFGTSGTTLELGGDGSGKYISNDNAQDVTLQYNVNSGNTINIPLRFYEFFAGKFLLTKLGAGTLTLSGDNQISKAIAVSAGTLNANSFTALGAASSTAGISVTSGATLSLGAAPTYSTRSLTISGTGSASAPNNGALVIANAGTSAFQSIVLGANGTYIRATNSGTINAPFTSNNNSIVFGASAGSNFIPFASLSNVFSGLGSVTYGGHSLDTGIVRADVRHIYTGNTTLAYGTTYVDSSLELPGTGGPLGNKSLTAANTLLMTGGTLSYLGGSVDYSGRFSTAGSQQWKIDAKGQAVTYATALVGASSLSMFDTSTGGSLTLSSASSTFSGGVTITSGTLYAGAAQNGVSGPLGITGTIAFGAVGTGTLAYTAASSSFDYSSRFATSSGQNRRINANGESVTFSTAMGGDNALLLVGSAGTLTLAVANTYTQGTTLSVGVLKCGNVTSIGTGGLAQANGTVLQVTATGGKLTIQGAHTNTGTGSRIIRIGA